MPNVPGPQSTSNQPKSGAGAKGRGGGGGPQGHMPTMDSEEERQAKRVKTSPANGQHGHRAVAPPLISTPSLQVPP